MNHKCPDLRIPDSVKTQHALTKALAAAASAAAEARLASQSASASARGAEEASNSLQKVKLQVDQILAGQYDVFVKALLDKKEFRESLVKVSDPQYRDLSLKLEGINLQQREQINRVDALSTKWPGGVLAAGLIVDGALVASTKGVSFNQSTGIVTFPGAVPGRFVPVVGSHSDNGTYLTASCWIKSVESTSFTIGRGAQDASGRVFPASRCSFVVIGSVD